jgi:hypothetical protein
MKLLLSSILFLFIFSNALAQSLPVITSQPLDGYYVIAGDNEVISVVADGESLSYQWQAALDANEWQDIPGETNSSFTKTFNKISDGGAFRVKVSNDFGTVLSSQSTVVVLSDRTKSYTPVSTPLTWAEAKEYAEGQGGYLLEINSMGEFAYVVYSLQSTFSSMTDSEYNEFLSYSWAPDGGNAAYLWLGGSDADIEGEWYWVASGEQFWSGDVDGFAVNDAFNYWGKTSLQNEPDNFQGSQNALALALETWPYGAEGTISKLGSAYQWNDLDPSNLLYFIIEKDLDGDGQVGNPPASVVEEDGDTSLLKNENGYFIGSESRPLLWEGQQLGELPGWTYLGVEEGTYYAFDLLLTSEGAYYVFYVDNVGNIADFETLSQADLRSYETDWNQDLDGDGQVGNPPASVVEEDGDTSLLKNENGYFIGSESRPLLWEGQQLGELPGWTYLGVEEGTYYAFDLLLTSEGAYYVFYVDNVGNIADFETLSQADLRSYETDWNQDLDGDGQVGNPPASVVEEDGDTSLSYSSSEDRYYIDYSINILYDGSPLGELPGWTYLGAEMNDGGGYNVILVNNNADEYLNFELDAEGNIIDSAYLDYSEVRNFEDGFDQDLDGDGYEGFNPNDFAPYNIYPGSVMETNDAYFFTGNNNDFVTFFKDPYYGVDLGVYSYSRINGTRGVVADSGFTEINFNGISTYNNPGSVTVDFSSPNVATNSDTGDDYYFYEPQDLAPTSLVNFTASISGYGFEQSQFSTGGFSNNMEIAFINDSSAYFYDNGQYIPATYTYQKVGPREGRINGYVTTAYGTVQFGYIVHLLTESQGYFVGTETSSWSNDTVWGSFELSNGSSN